MNLRRAPWRRVLSTVGLVGAIALLSQRACQNALASATVRFEVGAAGPALRHFRADLFRGDDPELVGYYEKVFDEHGAAGTIGPWSLRADQGTYRLEIELRTAAGVRTASRGLHLEDGASVTIDLTGDR
jgi:hypothetical protein